MTHKVDLVVYEQGRRRVIGSAVVDDNGGHLDVSGVVTDDHYKGILTDQTTLSISFKPVHDGGRIVDHIPEEVQPITFKGHIPKTD